jgi:hypothetical protein
MATEAPLTKSHNRMVLSLLALARIIREGENARFTTGMVWPVRVQIGFELAEFQNRICPASSHEANSNLAAINFFLTECFFW